MERRPFKIPIVKVVDQDDEEGVSFLGGPSPAAQTPAAPRPRSPSSPAALRAPGRGSRRVSLIPGEALEDAQTSMALATLLQAQEAGQEVSGVGIGVPCQPLHPAVPTSLPLPLQCPSKPRVMKAKTTDEVEAGSGDVDNATANSSPVRMKSNQRWLKLRTTVQLSGALSSSINKPKPPLKREDSFIKRFSTRQIAEIQDTVDQTDEEDISKTSTGSPKFRKKKKKRQPRTVINPYGNVYFYWLCSLTICVLYNLWTPIVRQAFPELQTSPQPLWFLLDGLTDIIFVVDILVQFRTGYLEQGLIVYDFKKLARHYMQSRSFLLDLVSLLPLDVLQLLIGTHPIIRFPRFVKVYRVYNYYYMVESRTLYPNMWRVVNLIHILLLLAHWFGCFYYMLSEAEHFRGDWTYPYHHDSAFKTLSRKYLGSVYWSTLTLTTIGDLPTPETNKHNKSTTTTTTTTSTTTTTTTSPTTTTTTTATSTATTPPPTPSRTPPPPLSPPTRKPHDPGGIKAEEVEPVVKDIENGGSGARGGEEGSSAVRKEVSTPLPRRGLTSRLLRIKTDAGYVFTIVSYLIGVFIFATIVGQVGNVITNRNANRLEFERLLDGAKLYMRHHKVPRAMQRRVQRWYDYSWSRGRIQGGGDINTALGLLPDKLRTELALHVNLLTLKKVSIFKECQPEFLHDLVLKMKAYIFTPGDLICRKGEVAREMFIIADGILEVISETGKVLTTMKAGDFFGEIGILNLDGLNKSDLGRRTADVRSVGYSELFSLSREDVLMAMKDYPEAQEILQSLGRKRLMEARHTTSKSGSSGSSKRGSPSPNREGGSDDKNAKKIVSRLRSDVSAIRNAFRRSKGATREADTLEMDALDARSSTEDDTPAVKKILKRISGRSGSDSGSGQRGVLIRMARVTSDEMNQGTSPGRVPSGDDTTAGGGGGGGGGGVLGAGLPLLQRLKLLKEKEEKEEKERQRIEEERKKEEEVKKEEEEEEPEVIGAGLPLFARLKLLKAKEEKERLEREEKEKQQQQQQNNQGETPPPPPPSTTPKPPPATTTTPATTTETPPKALTATPRSGGLFKNRLRAAILSDAPSGGAGGAGGVPSRPTAPKDTTGDKDEAKPAKTPPGDVAKGSTTGESSTNTIQSSPLDRALGKLLKKPAVTATAAATAVTTAATPAATNNNNNDSKDKIARSDSFKRAMAEGRISSTDEHHINRNILAPPVLKSMKEDEGGGTETPTHPLMVTPPHATPGKVTRRSSDPGAAGEGKIAKARRGSAGRESETPTVLLTQPTGASLDRPLRKVDSLKVPTEDVSPPLSSPESYETPERKTLKSILKRMSREDSRGNLLPPDSADLRRLMTAPTVEGFVARRSKLSKSVSFQRKTLSSPPPPAFQDGRTTTTTTTIEPLLATTTTTTTAIAIPDDQTVASQLTATTALTTATITTTTTATTTDGVNKLILKLSAIGLDGAQDNQAQDLLVGVRKILRDKMEDVEVAWVSRVKELQQELEARDATIKQLTHTISLLQQSGGEGGQVTEREGHVSLTRIQTIVRSSSDTSSEGGYDEDEPLFMRCNSIESIIHQSPGGSPGGRHPQVTSRHSWSHQVTVEQQQQQQTRQARAVRSLEEPRGGRGGEVRVHVGSSTDDDVCSFSSEDDHAGLDCSALEDDLDESLSDDLFNMDDDDEEEEEGDEEREGGGELSSQDWEVQLLARKLAEDQRGFARRVDRDIAEGRLKSTLVDLHEALATDNLGPLTESDLLRLEKVVLREREKLRRYASLYSLEDRPLLEDQFSSLYRSRSQLLLTRSSELCRAGPIQRRLSQLLTQLARMPPAEQFLLDRLVYTTDRRRRLSRQRSLCDDQLTSFDASSRASLRRPPRSLATRRSKSVCSPPPPTPPAPAEKEKEEGGSGQSSVSAMLASLHRSVAAIRGRTSGVSRGSLKEGAPLLRPSR